MTKKRDSARKLIKGGVIVSVIFTILFEILFPVILLLIMLVVGMTTGIFEAIAAAMAEAGGAEPVETEIDFSFMIPYVIAMIVSLSYSFVAMILNIVSVALINHANKKGALVACGILSIIGSIPFIFIPLSLIGGIKALTLKNEDLDLNNKEPEPVKE